MKKILAICLAAGALACGSCGQAGRSGDTAAAQEDSTAVAPAIALDGQWNIDNIVVSDSVYARPAEETPGHPSYIQFDSTGYSIMTNCNHIQGTYTLAGDSIVMNPGLCTEMACDNMRVEDLIKTVLPAIRTVDVLNDSVVRLNGSEAQYIVLSRMKEQVK